MNNNQHLKNNLSPDSVQLSVGQKFHHQGKNGVTYFSLQVEKASDGSIFPMTETAPACNAIPLEFDGAGNVIAGYFLVQRGRPEQGEEAVALKATGSFCKADESTKDCAIRSLKDKIGIGAQVNDLIFVGQSYGFGPQFCFPIDLFVIKDYTVLETELTTGCERIRMTIDDIAKAHNERRFFNSETIDIIASILLRNQSKETFTW